MKTIRTRLLIALVLACGVALSAKEPKALPAPDLMNFTHLEKDLSKKPAVIRNGRFSGDHLDIRVLMTAEGQLGGDAQLDGVAVCLEDGGGSGNFRQLCLLINQGGRMTHMDTHFLGDRIRMKSVSVVKGLITIEFLDRGPNDAMSVPPYLLKTWTFKAVANKLVRQK